MNTNNTGLVKVDINRIIANSTRYKTRITNDFGYTVRMLETTTDFTEVTLSWEKYYFYEITGG